MIIYKSVLLYININLQISDYLFCLFNNFGGVMLNNNTYWN
jgi:hypothetical protein